MRLLRLRVMVEVGDQIGWLSEISLKLLRVIGTQRHGLSEGNKRVTGLESNPNHQIKTVQYYSITVKQHTYKHTIEDLL